MAIKFADVHKLLAGDGQDCSQPFKFNSSALNNLNHGRKKLPSPTVLLQQWREKQSLTLCALQNAQKLLEGRFKELLIVGQEPCNSADEETYEDMYESSPTLKEVDALIKESSDEENLQTVPFADINVMLSDETQQETEDVEGVRLQSHEVFINLVRAQQPKVMLIMTCKGKESLNSDVRTKFWSSLYHAGSVHRIKLWTREIVVVRAFHPSSYLRRDHLLTEEETDLRRRMLRECFQLALHACRGDCEEVDQSLFVEWRAYVRSISVKAKNTRDNDETQYQRPSESYQHQTNEAHSPIPLLDAFAKLHISSETANVEAN